MVLGELRSLTRVWEPSAPKFALDTFSLAAVIARPMPNLSASGVVRLGCRERVLVVMPCIICDEWVLEYGDIIWERLPFRDTTVVTPEMLLKGYHRGEDLWLAYCPNCWCMRQAVERHLDAQSSGRVSLSWREREIKIHQEMSHWFRSAENSED